MTPVWHRIKRNDLVLLYVALVVTLMFIGVGPPWAWF